MLEYGFRLMNWLITIVRGMFGKSSIEYVIDGDTGPRLRPTGSCGVESHRKLGELKIARFRGNLYINKKRVCLFLSKNQRVEESIEGTVLLTEMAPLNALNANVLDFLYYEHPELIPTSWKGGEVFFWGTIYRDASGDLGVRGLWWGGDDKWHTDYVLIINHFTDNQAAAVLAM